MSDLFDGFYAYTTNEPQKPQSSLIESLKSVRDINAKLGPRPDKTRCCGCRAWLIPGITKSVEIVSGDSPFAPTLAYACEDCAEKLVAFTKSEQEKKVNM